MKKVLGLLALVGVLLVGVTAEAAIIDLGAIGAVATANSVYVEPVVGGNASDAIDGNVATQWNAGNHGTISDPNWLKVDLGSLYDIDTVTLTVRDTGYSSSYHIQYELLYSLDDTVWNMGGAGALYDDPLLNVNTLSLGGNTSRYLLFNVIGGSHWSSLAEMEISGEEYTDGNGSNDGAPVPEPASMALLGLSLSGLAFRKKK